MAFPTSLLTTHFIKPFPSYRSSTTMCARFPSRMRPPLTIASLMKRSDSSDSNSDDDSDAPIPKGCPLKNKFLERGRVLPYLVKEREDTFQAKLDMPGISKEGLKVWVESHCLHIKGEEEENGDEDDGDDEEEENGPRSYFGVMEFAEGRYILDQVKADLRNGVLKVVIPKVKLEERKDVFFVKVN